MKVNIFEFSHKTAQIELPAHSAAADVADDDAAVDVAVVVVVVVVAVDFVASVGPEPAFFVVPGSVLASAHVGTSPALFSVRAASPISAAAHSAVVGVGAGAGA